MDDLLNKILNKKTKPECKNKEGCKHDCTVKGHKTFYNDAFYEGTCDCCGKEGMIIKNRCISCPLNEECVYNGDKCKAKHTILSEHCCFKKNCVCIKEEKCICCNMDSIENHCMLCVQFGCFKGTEIQNPQTITFSEMDKKTENIASNSNNLLNIPSFSDEKNINKEINNESHELTETPVESKEIIIKNYVLHIKEFISIENENKRKLENILNFEVEKWNELRNAQDKDLLDIALKHKIIENIDYQDIKMNQLTNEEYFIQELTDEIYSLAINPQWKKIEGDEMLIFIKNFTFLRQFPNDLLLIEIFQDVTKPPFFENDNELIPFYSCCLAVLFLHWYCNVNAFSSLLVMLNVQKISLNNQLTKENIIELIGGANPAFYEMYNYVTYSIAKNSNNYLLPLIDPPLPLNKDTTRPRVYIKIENLTQLQMIAKEAGGFGDSFIKIKEPGYKFIKNSHTELYKINPNDINITYFDFQLIMGDIKTYSELRTSVKCTKVIDKFLSFNKWKMGEDNQLVLTPLLFFHTQDEIVTLTPKDVYNNLIEKKKKFIFSENNKLL